jgi:hypothetical protein
MTTFGTLEFIRCLNGAGQWRVTSTPDIIMRIHRIFPRMSRPSSRELTAVATPDFANDLEWMLHRYPMECPDLARLKESAASYRDSQERLFALDRCAPPVGRYTMAIPAREYQAQAAAIYLEQGFLLIGDVVGLGKTVSAIASFTDTRTMPAVVVVKAHLPMQWKAEIERFLAGARVHIIKRSEPYDLPPADVYVISYHKLGKWWGDLAKICRSVVFDEIQELRLMDSAKYRAAKSMCQEIPFRLGLSATPIHNYGDEIWAIFNLLAPDSLGNSREFEREWCAGKMVRDPDALGHYLRNQHLFIRRTRKEVGRELPAITRFVEEIPYDEKVYADGVASADELARIILSGSFLERGQAAREFDVKMRQATGLAKAPYVADLVRMLVDSGEKVLLAGWHRSVYDVWKSRLADKRPAFYTGHESAIAKEMSRCAFINGETDVLIMSLRSGAGLNGLQNVCSVVVFGELDWTPAVHEQFIGRLARDGQESPVQVFIPVIPVGCDPTMANVLGLKRAQATGIVDLGEEISEHDFTDTDPQRVKQLAVDFLTARGEKIPTQEAA